MASNRYFLEEEKPCKITKLLNNRTLIRIRNNGPNEVIIGGVGLNLLSEGEKIAVDQWFESGLIEGSFWAMSSGAWIDVFEYA